MVFEQIRAVFTNQITKILTLIGVFLTLVGNAYTQEEKLIFTFILGDTDSSEVVQGIKDLFEEYPFLKGRIKFYLFTSKDQKHMGTKRVTFSHITVIDVMDQNLIEGFRKTLGQFYSQRGKIYAVREGSGSTELDQKLGIIHNPKVKAYYGYGGSQNIKNLILFILSQDQKTLPNIVGISGIKVAEPIKPPDAGIYHPGNNESSKAFEDYNSFLEWYKNEGYFKSKGDWVGIIFYSASLNSGQLEVQDMLIHELEKAGFNILAAFGYPPERIIQQFMEDEAGRSRVRVLTSFMFRMGSRAGAKNQLLLQKLGVPVINLISLYSDSYQEWIDSKQGLNPFEVGWQITIPEINGLIQPTVIGSQERVIDPETGLTLVITKPIKERVHRVVSRVKAWINLQKKPNSEKKLALIYYNYPPGKQNIGASYLNVVASIRNIIQKLREQGYKVGNQLPNQEQLLNILLKSGRNIANWAPGELERMVIEGKAILLPIENYQQWLRELPSEFVYPINRDWGKIEDSQIMLWQDKKAKRYIIIPGIQQGNIVILPQPALGWIQNLKKLYHSKSLAPHHQYVAFYLWLKRDFKADAIIHLGTHGTHEWLSGKEAGLSGKDAPEVLIQDLPNIYLYVVDDVAEGIHAKRRGAAVIIDHMIPPLKRGGLYHEYIRLKELANQHLIAHNKGNPILSQEYIKEVKNLLTKLSLDKDLKLDKEKLDCGIIHRIDEYLKELKEMSIPFGLHTFGQIPNKEYRLETAQAILEIEKKLDAKAQKVKLAEIEKKIIESGKRELNSLIRALSGRYIPPGTGNDPIRNPDSLPTGKNFYAFDPLKIPRLEAWNIGIKMTKQLLQKYRDEHQGQYPEKISIVLWATETIRHEGVSESQALYLMGIKPVWDTRDKLIDLEVIPPKELNRPRIDVVFNPSGLYRDTFPHLIELLDKAVQKVKRLKEKDNWIRKHFQEYKEELINQGIADKKAEQLASIRIFSEPSGEYGNKVSKLVSASGSWDNDSAIANVYIRQVGHGYGSGLWGEPMEEVFKTNLKDTQVVVHSLSSNLYGTLDNDDFYSFVGGLAMAIRQLDGHTPQLIITNLANPAKPEMSPLEKSMGLEIRSRYLNPRWIKGMKQEGYEGANEMAKYVENLWGWQVTVPDIIDPAKWEQTYEVYVKDKYNLGLKEFFAQNNPWAYQALTARMLEAIRKGYWKPKDKTVLQTLAKEYLINTIQYGVACCEHTCNNPAFNQYALNILSIPGIINPQSLFKFQERIQLAIGKSLEKAQGEMEQLKQGLHERRASEKPGEKGEKKIVKGYELKEIAPEKESNLTTSGTPWMPVLLILVVLALFGYGWTRNRLNSS
jgi:cobaltochelatase CobN